MLAESREEKELPSREGKHSEMALSTCRKALRDLLILRTASRRSSPSRLRSSTMWFSVRQSRGVLPGSHVHPPPTRAGLVGITALLPAVGAGGVDCLGPPVRAWVFRFAGGVPAPDGSSM
jgi:hypothetical protein